MKILIAGYGFVGQAQELILKDHFETIIHDPDLDYKANTRNVDAVVVCVSTPARPDGSCEMKNVYEAIEASPNVPILIKSTISVEGWDAIVDAFPGRQICFSPEFLRAEHWKEDTLNQKQMYIGGNCVQFWTGVYVQAVGYLAVDVKPAKELVAAKAFRNSYLALKVSFFNQVYDYCKAYDLNYDDVRQAIALDDRIGASHTKVTEERGFGGHCFPKDVRAIIRSAQRNNTRLTLLEEAINYNNSIRKT
jgi:UDPglucose 6-dehydrogenase